MSDSAPVSYCYRWNYRRHKPGTPLSEEEARKRDQAGDEYTAVLAPLPDEEHPVLVTVVWENDYLDVSFPDEFGRLGTRYVFGRVNEKHLFLHTMYLYSYPSDDPSLRRNESSRMETYDFGEDGTMSHRVDDDDAQESTITEYTDVPVDKNWEPVPAFGDWASVARYER